MAVRAPIVEVEALPVPLAVEVAFANSDGHASKGAAVFPLALFRSGQRHVAICRQVVPPFVTSTAARPSVSTRKRSESLLLPSIQIRPPLQHVSRVERHQYCDNLPKCEHGERCVR